MSENTLTCSYCNKNFSTKSNLTAHIKNTKKCLLKRNVEEAPDEFDIKSVIWKIMQNMKQMNNKLEYMEEKCEIIESLMIKNQDVDSLPKSISFKSTKKNKEDIESLTLLKEDSNKEII